MKTEITRFTTNKGVTLLKVIALILIGVFISLPKNSSACNASFSVIDSFNYVYFNNTSSASNTATWSWSFGDGTYSNQENPVHEYNSFGPFLVCLTVTDTAANCSDTQCDSIYINNNGGNCNALFSYSASGLDVYFLNYSLSCGAPVWSWSFGDGTTSTDVNPSHTYASSGWYYVYLGMQDTSCNCSDSVAYNIYISGANNGCDANFAIYPDSSQQGLYWGYNYSTGQNLIYYWWWGDGGFSTGPYPSHTYIDSGYYTICLSIFDTISFCSDSVCNDYYIMKQAKMDQIHEIIFVNATGISSLTSPAEVVWSIFPNPATNDFRIQTNGQKIDEVRITDLSGRTLKTIANYTGKNISLEQIPQETLIIETKIDGVWSSKLLIKE